MKLRILSITISVILSVSLANKCVSSELIEEYIAKKTSVLNNLAKHLQMHTEHLEDFKNSLQDSLQIMNVFNSENFLIFDSIVTKNIASIRQHEKMINLINNPVFFRGEYFLVKEKDDFLEQANAVLNEFFTRRFELLSNRSQNLKIAHARKENNEPGSYAWTTNPNRQNELNDFEKIMANVTTDTYQTFNRTIVGLLSLTDLHSLPANIQEMVCMSPSLWDRIAKPSNDWGHPDEAIFENQDLDLYEHYLYRKGELTTQPTSIIRTESESDMCPLFAQAKISASSSILPEAPPATKEELAKIAKKKANTAKRNKEKREKKKRLAAKAPSELGASTGSDVDESDTDDLPDSENDSKAKEGSSGDSYETKPSGDVPGAITNETAEGEGVVDENEFIDQDAYDPSLEHQKHKIRKATGIPTATYEEKKNDIFSHLKGSAYTIYQSIMNPIFHSVSYDNFTTLWNQLGGEIHTPKGGGSHRSLSFRGQTLPIGTYVPHNGTYGKNCIKYLKQALQHIAQFSA